MLGQVFYLEYVRSFLTILLPDAWVEPIAQSIHQTLSWLFALLTQIT